VLPLTDRKTIFLFRQTKYAVQGTSLAPIGGYIEPGEETLTAAKRELREEMGCEALEWIPLGDYSNNGNHGGGRGHLFLALNTHKVGEPIIDDLEEMELVELTIEETEQKLLQGEVKVMGWVAMIAMGLLHLRKHF
jgi:ADP-ribose pyrophosphatase